jgi:diguanylate cyclase (GGDEF)-like protein
VGPGTGSLSVSLNGASRPSQRRAGEENEALGNHEPPRKRPQTLRREGNPARRPPVREDAAPEVDQTTADLDQTASDADQTASDADRAASERDQAEADADQHASDRDQEASDRELAAHVPAAPDFQRAHEISRTERQDTASARNVSALLRAQTTVERADTADHRDESARFRDLTAEARDKAAEERDRLAAASEHALGPGRGDAVAIRARAAADRARAAADREQAARDREEAAGDREQLRAQLQRAHLDDLTGVYRRAIGSVVLQREMDRARRSGRPLVVAFVDINGLKEVNDEQGHAVGDALLREVAAAIRSRLRSYDPIVRFGGDEFVCGLSDTDLDQARRRFDEIKATLAESWGDASISVGLTTQRPGDSLEELVARADDAMYDARTDG